ncbi:MAG: three-Cys-motif partner protein TcmP [Rhodospirillales bacterium]
MKLPDFYKGREQTYLKHLFLENYLERVAYNIFSFKKDFVYVDGFSGPWRSENEDYEDTSFKKAINKLRHVREGIKNSRNIDVNFRCLFIEKDPKIFKELESVVGQINDVEIRPICGDFESLIPNIIDFIGNSFSLVFIDPTGWTGFGLQKIQPLLMKRGEVIDLPPRNRAIHSESLFL